MRNNTLFSPDRSLAVGFDLDATGAPLYSLSLGGRTLLNSSRLGLATDRWDLSSGLNLESASSPEAVTDKYILPQGKRRHCVYRANRRVFHLKSAAGVPIDIEFQVSNDGAAFRYRLPGPMRGAVKILKETSSFSFPPGTNAFIQPAQEARTGYEGTNPAYEEYYVQGRAADRLPESPAGWVFPALFQSGSDWILLSETAPETAYCGCRLEHVEGSMEFRIGFPRPREEFPGGALFPESTLPWTTPWRIIVAGQGLGRIVESTLGTDLAPPARPLDFSFVTPGRASWSWALLKDQATVFDVQKRFIDFAADMGWEYCLVDAFWDAQIGYEKIAELAGYAAKKSVGLILWYNSAGSWNSAPQTPRNALLTRESREREFARLQAMGVKGVKVDFFGGDGQSMLGYYRDIFEDAARFRLVVNCHGAVIPRGWQRTYPNFLTAEAVKGFEYVTFEQAWADGQPEHCATLPFTRNVFDPMDFTPLCFSEVPDITRVTSNAFELALSVLFTSGIQHYVEIPEGMAKAPDFVKAFLRGLPAAWDEVRFLDGYPGKFVVIARRAGKTWYAAGTNAEATGRKLNLRLPFLAAAAEGTLITDGPAPASGPNRSFRSEKITVDPAAPVKITIEPRGGFVIKTGG